MSSVIWHVTMSVDGFIDGPDDSMDWVFAQRTDDTGEPGDIRVDKSSMADEIVHTTGAILAGRRWYEIATSRFNGVDGIYGGAWKGPVFVLTHRPPESGHHPAVSFVSEDVRDAEPRRATPLRGGTSSSSGPTSRSNVCAPGCWTSSSSILCRFCSETAFDSSTHRASGLSLSGGRRWVNPARSPICAFGWRGSNGRPSPTDR
jgi:hypothetical protein